MNQSGYIREAAAVALARQPHPDTLPFVLWLQRDWVPQVRAAARTTLDSYMHPSMAESFLRHYALIKHLNCIRRVDLSPTIDAIDAFLEAEETASARDSAMNSGDSGLRAFVFRLLKDSLAWDKGLQARAASDSEALIRRWFASQLDRLKAKQRKYWIEKLSHDKSTIVALSAVRAIEDADSADLRPLLIEKTCSDSLAMRAASRQALADMSREDFREQYLERLDETHGLQPPCGLVGGLADTGGPNDFPLLLTLSVSAKTRVRFEAIRGLIRIDRERSSQTLLAHLSDTSNRVRRYIARTFASGVLDAEMDYLHKLLRSDRDELASETAMRALTGLGSWDAVPAILLGASSAHDRLRSKAWQQGEFWFREHAASGWLKPSPRIQTHLLRATRQFRAEHHTPPSRHAVSWQQLIQWIDSVTGQAQPH